MKTNGILITRKLWLTAFVLLVMGSSKAQSGADFQFINFSLISGVNLQAGSIYTFTNVRAGIDCRVTIAAITPGTQVDNVDDNSNGTGFPEAFQPRIRVNGNTRGYGEFVFRFVKAGTNIDTMVAEIPATSIDIDGNGSGPDSLLEFDEYLLPAAYILDYDMLAGQLTFNWQPGSILGRHKAAIEYTGIDTVGRSVMFTVVYPHASTFTVRIGVDNARSGNTTRQRSVYFKRFVYPNSFLPVKDLRSFAGVAQSNAVKLSWSMNRGHDIISADVERSLNGHNFSKVGSVAMASENNGAFTENAAAANTWYRIKMTDAHGKVSYSEVLVIKTGAASQQSFKVFPSVVKDYTTVSFSAANAGSASMWIVDNNGRIVRRLNMAVHQGSNSTVIDNIGRVPAGQYVVVVNGAGYSYTQKILIAK